MRKHLDSIALVLGVLGFFMWPVHYAGIPLNLVGLVLGIVVHRERRSRMATTAIVLSAIGLALTVTDMTFGLLDLMQRTYFQDYLGYAVSTTLIASFGFNCSS